MLTFINPKCDVSLAEFFNFDIAQTINHKSISTEDSLTLGCSFGRQLKTTSFLTKQEHNIENVNIRLMVQNAAKELEEKIGLTQRHVTIKHAVSYHLSKNHECKTKDQKLVTLENKYCFLRLASDVSKIDLDSCIFDLQTKSLTPVLVFPEKSEHFSTKTLSYFDRLNLRNCMFQCDILGLTGIYGDHVKNLLTSLLEKRLVGFFGLELKNIGYLKGVNNLRLGRKAANILSKQMWTQI